MRFRCRRSRCGCMQRCAIIRADSEASRLIENATAEAARIVRDAQSPAEVAAASCRWRSVAIFFHGELAAVTNGLECAKSRARRLLAVCT